MATSTELIIHIPNDSDMPLLGICSSDMTEINEKIMYVTFTAP